MSRWDVPCYELPETEDDTMPAEPIDRWAVPTYELPECIDGCGDIFDLSGAAPSRKLRSLKPPWENAVYVHEYKRHIPNKPYGEPEVNVIEHYRHAVAGEHIENAMYIAAADALECYAGAVVNGDEPYTEIGFDLGGLVSDVASAASSAVSSVASAVTSPLAALTQAPLGMFGQMFPMLKPVTNIAQQATSLATNVVQQAAKQAVSLPLQAVKLQAQLVKPLASVAAKIISPVVQTATAAAKTLVTGIRKYNPIALAKYAAIKAEAAAGSLLHGVMLNTLKAVGNTALAPALTIIKAAGPVMPYATSVVALVPGCGTGVAAALGAAQAIADGRSLTEALIAGVRSAIPGGQLAQIAFDATRGIIMAKKEVDTHALEALRKQLPASASKGMDYGVAMAAAQKAQTRRVAVKKAAFQKVATTVAKKLAA